MHIGLLSSFSFIWALSAFAENDTLPLIYDTVTVQLFVKDSKNEQPLENAYAIVNRNGSYFFTSDTTTHKGKIKLQLPIDGSEYTISICKKGYYTKILSVSTKSVPNKRMKRSFYPIEAEVWIFEHIPNINFEATLGKPLKKFYYSKSDDEFVEDFDYTVKVMKELEMVETKKKEYEMWKKDSLQSAIVNRADSFYNAAGEKILKTWKGYDTTLLLAALKDYYSAIHLKPDFWQAYLGKANIHVSLKQYEQAISDYTVAIKYAGTSASAVLYHSRGVALYYSGNYDYAIKDLDQAIEMKGMKDVSLLFRAKAKWELGKKEEACEDYKKAILLNKDLEKNREFLEC